MKLCNLDMVCTVNLEIRWVWARILSGPDKFKRVIKYHTLSTSFNGGFKSTF